MPQPFYPRAKRYQSPWVGNRLWLRVGLDVLESRKMSSSWRESNHDSPGCPVLTSDDFFWSVMRTVAVCCPPFTRYEGYSGSHLASRTVRSPVNCIFVWERVHTAAVSVSCELCDNQVLSYKPGFSSADMTQWYEWVMTPPVLDRAYRIVKIMLPFDVQLWCMEVNESR